MTTQFRLWRDGLLITSALIALGVYWATKVGLESGWILESWNGAPAPANAPDLQLRDRGFLTDLVFQTPVARRRGSHLTLRTACSPYEGPYTRGFHQIRVGRLSPAWTCASVDGPLLATFQRVSRYTIKNGRLTLTAQDGHALVFRRATWPLGAAPGRHYEQPAA